MKISERAMYILDETQSICPVCHKPVKAFYAIENENDPQTFKEQDHNEIVRDGCCSSQGSDRTDSCCGDDSKPDNINCCTADAVNVENCCCEASTQEPERSSCCCTPETETAESSSCCCGTEQASAETSCCCGTEQEPQGSSCCEAEEDNGGSCCCGTESFPDGRVYFIKECPEHGIFRTTAAENAGDYMQWVKNPVINIPPEKAMTEGDPNDMECPLHCGTCENHLQTACCVLIDITDRCNQHCPYCFAKAEEDADRSSEPTLEEIEAKYDLLLELGEERPFNIQLSGGEPTVREDLPQIIKMARDKGFEYVQINTNGRKLALVDGYAQLLKDAGATVIFMQFDGTRDDIYQQLRGEPLFEMKKQAIRNCEKSGLAVTLVPTMVEGVNMDNIGEMMDFLVDNVNVVKGIHFQPVSFFGRHPEKISDEGCCSQIHSGDFPGRVTMFGLLRELEKQRPEFKYDDFCPIATGHTLCCFYSTYTRERDGSVKCALTGAQRDKGVSCCEAEGNYDIGDNCCCGDEQGAGSAQGISCCDMTSADKLEVIKKDRDYVLDKWEIAPAEETSDADECTCCCNEPSEDTCCGTSEAESGDCCCGSEAETADIPCCCTPEVETETSCCCGSEESTSCCCSEPQETEESCCCGTYDDDIMDIDEFLRYYRQNTFTVTGMAFQDITNLDAERVKRCRVQVLSPDDKLIPFCAYNTIYRK